MFGDGNWYFLVAWCYIVFCDVFCAVVECFQLCFGIGNVGFTLFLACRRNGVGICWYGIGMLLASFGRVLGKYCVILLAWSECSGTVVANLWYVFDTVLVRFKCDIDTFLFLGLCWYVFAMNIRV